MGVKRSGYGMGCTYKKRFAATVLGDDIVRSIVDNGVRYFDKKRTDRDSCPIAEFKRNEAVRLLTE